MSEYETGVVWPVAGGVQWLATLPGDPAIAVAIPIAANVDGSVIVGKAIDAAGVAQPVRWDDRVLTQLAAVSGIGQAVYCSQDASIIVGTPADNRTAPYARWTSGGTAGALLAPAGADTDASGIGFFGAVLAPQRACSDDGNVIVGLSLPSSTVTYWTAGTPTAITPEFPLSISADGTIILGVGPSGSPDPCYWTAGTRTDLNNFYSPPVGPLGNAPFAITGDNSRIYGIDVTSAPLYWDSLSTVGSFGHGVIHYLDLPGGVIADYAPVIAETNNVAVGQSTVGAVLTAIRWDDTTATALPTLAGASYGAAAQCVSGTGAVIAGRAITPTTSWAVYWDASNAVHQLPLPTPPAGATITASEVRGISRDGTLIFGVVRVSAADPVPPEHLAPVPMVYLEWSDDGGKTWSNPVGQSLGAIGEYRTQLQWNRLGMARNRVFRLFWTIDAPTALLGAYLDATPARS